MASTENTTSPEHGRVRWRRFAVIMLPAAVIASVLIALTARGAIAASFAVSGQQFTVTATKLTGTGFEQYGSTFKEANGKEQPVAVSVIRNATLSNLCQSVKVLGVTLRITAGSGSTPVTASNLVVGATDLSGDATFKNISVGQDASTLNQAPGETGQAGTFAQQASSVSISGVHQVAWSTTAGTFTLPGFHLQVGGSPC
ncbi:MAG TPA: DUF6230 family protein [Streptosporangiaceae bacterium]